MSIKIEGNIPEEKQKMFGRHFEVDDELVSHISRRSIDMLKANYRDDLSINEWKLVAKLKNLFKILFEELLSFLENGHLLNVHVNLACGCSSKSQTRFCCRVFAF